LVYDPLTLDLGIVVPGVTTGFDVNALLIQGGGTICGALDVAGAPIVVSEAVASIASTTVENCDSENGVAVLEPSDYIYSWSDGVQGAVRSDLADGTYTVTATNNEGCTDVLTVVIEEECICIEPFVSQIIVMDEMCGMGNGSIEIVVNGDPADYMYTFSPNAGTPNAIGNIRTDLLVGVYDVMITNPAVPDCFKLIEGITVGSIGGPEVTSKK